MKLFHQGLKDLLLIQQYSSIRKFGFLSIELPVNNFVKKIINVFPNYHIGLNLRREYRHILMGIQSLKLKDIDTIIVLEAYNQHLFILLPLLALTGKDIFIILHGNQPLAMQNKFKYLGLLYLKKYLQFFNRFKAILLEIDDDIIPNKFRLPINSKIIIPHPLISKAKPRLEIGERISYDESIKIGIVGILRADKPIAKLSKILEEYVRSSLVRCELIIGTPLKQKPKYLNNLNCIIYDTTKEENYLKVLNEIDILVVDYEKNNYYYRASGVVSDAASSGCYIIAPDYPVIRNQIKYPVTIGSTFQSLTDLNLLLDKAIVYLRQNGQDNHWLWRSRRGAEHIAKILNNEV